MQSFLSDMPNRAPAGAHTRTPRYEGGLSAAVLLLLLSACDGVQSTLEANGPAAAKIADLYWLLTAISALIFLLVCGLLAYALFRRRNAEGERPPLRLTPKSAKEKRERLEGESDGGGGEGGDGQELTESDDTPLDIQLDTAESDRKSVRWVVAGGVAMPAVILIGVFIFTLDTLGFVHNQDEPPFLTIEVIGWQWWWEARYLDAQGEPLFETANELHIPAGKRVQVRLKSADVIHSFWVPQLAGKLDMIPGRTNQFWIQADEPGIYRGQCAEYCEEQHAHMAFLVIAEPEAEFREWVAHQAQPAPVPDDPLALAGREVFMSNACAACHAVRGTPAVGEIAPDLTHVASRLTLGAVTISNTKGHMGGWINNPQEIKPAVKMPAVPLDSEEFVALLHYMQSLK
jgi:cytochrome c oxidase subunit 2